MLRPHLQTLLGCALSTARVEDSPHQRVPAASEDGLTSSVLAGVGYLPPSVQWDVLAAAGPRAIAGHPSPTRASAGPRILGEAVACA